LDESSCFAVWTASDWSTWHRARGQTICNNHLFWFTTRIAKFQIPNRITIEIKVDQTKSYIMWHINAYHIWEGPTFVDTIYVDVKSIVSGFPHRFSPTVP
jgi:hypothetical protein